MYKYMALMWASMAMTTGCFGIGRYVDFEPATPMTVGQWEAVNHVESRVEAAIITFGRPAFKVRPRITVVTDPAQFIPKFQKAWKDLPDAFGAKARVPSEGYSGLWHMPDIYVSVVGDRTDKFLDIYAHERAHTFFAGGHPAELVEVAAFLKGE